MLQKKRSDQAVELWRKKMGGEGKLDENNRLTDEAGGAARTKREEERIRKGARIQAFRDAKQGKVTALELAEVQGDMLNQAAEKLAKEGKLNDIQLTAVKQIVGELKRQNSDLSALHKQYQSLKDEVTGLAGPRSRGQLRAQMSQGSR